MPWARKASGGAAFPPTEAAPGQVAGTLRAASAGNSASFVLGRVLRAKVAGPAQSHPDEDADWTTFVPLVIMAFWIGIYPKPFFEILEQPVNQLVTTVRPDYPKPAPVSAATPAVPAAEAAAVPARETN